MDRARKAVSVMTVLRIDGRDLVDGANEYGGVKRRSCEFESERGG